MSAYFSEPCWSKRCKGAYKDIHVTPAPRGLVTTCTSCAKRVLYVFEATLDEGRPLEADL